MKTLAERAEEAYLLQKDYQERKKLADRKINKEGAILYFQLALREAAFCPEKDRFILEGEEFNYDLDVEATYIRDREMPGINYAYKIYKLIGKFGSFNNLAGYGGYLRKKREAEENTPEKIRAHEDWVNSFYD